jgi:hypothetical protein
MQPAPTTQPPGTGPTPPETPRPILGRIGAVLRVARAKVAYGRYFTAAAPIRAAQPEFAPVAAVFGTYDITTMLFRVKRGILRALALQRYLLARAARGRNLRFIWPPCVDLQPHHRKPLAPPRAKPIAPRRATRKEPSLLDDDDPRAFYLPTDAELDAEMRRRPVGRTMTYICLDLGIVPGFCEDKFFDGYMNAIRRYGGSLAPLFDVRARRAKTFERERDRRPETWHIAWDGVPNPAVRQALGLLIGEPAQHAGFSPGAEPAPVPS